MTGDTPAAPATYYAATAVAHRPRPRLVSQIEAAVCIVGGGFAGLWTARALARRGYDVVVLEGRRIAGEASGRNGGFVAAGYAERLSRIIDRVGLDHARALYALSREGIELMRAMIAEGVPGVDPVPGRLNVLRYDDAEGVKRQAGLLAEHFDHDVLIWPTERVRETLKTRRYYQALHDADAFSIHPYNLALALAEEIERLGGRIFEQSPAVDVDLDGMRKWVATAGGRVRTHQVVFCGSAFIGEIFPALARAILPVSTHIAVTAPIADILVETIRYAGGISDNRRAGNYYRIVGDRLMWGGGITTQIKLPRRLQRMMARDMASVYPQLKGVAIEYAWSGVMGYAIHRMPQIGLVRPGVWIASAFGGHGLNTTAIGAELVAAAIGERDDRWRLFIPYGLVWAGGGWGRRAMQIVYRSMQIRDRIDEAYSRIAVPWAAWRRAAAIRRAERKAVRAKAADEAAIKRARAARIKAEERAAKKKIADEAARVRAAEKAARKKADAEAARIRAAESAAERKVAREKAAAEAALRRAEKKSAREKAAAEAVRRRAEEQAARERSEAEARVRAAADLRARLTARVEAVARREKAAVEGKPETVPAAPAHASAAPAWNAELAARAITTATIARQVERARHSAGSVLARAGDAMKRHAIEVAKQSRVRVEKTGSRLAKNLTVQSRIAAEAVRKQSAAAAASLRHAAAEALRKRAERKAEKEKAETERRARDAEAAKAAPAEVAVAPVPETAVAGLQETVQTIEPPAPEVSGERKKKQKGKGRTKTVKGP
jgi:glycine/D-amino acid oxidase-like deaminating enzyme